MKKNKLLMPFLTFLIGVGVGVTPLAFYSFRSTGTEISQAGLRVVSATEANTLHKNYVRTAVIPTSPVRGFYLDTLVVNAIRLIAKENAALPGFRIYLGKDANNDPVGLVVGVDNRGLDATSNTMFRANTSRSGPCPFICDVSSSIVRE